MRSSIKKKVLMSVIFFIGIVVIFLLSWAVILYFYYGQQTFLFLVKAPRATIWQYSKNIFFKKPVSPSRVKKTGTVAVAVPQASTTLGTTNTQKTTPLEVFTIPRSHTIATMTHVYQKLNNCGPTSIEMAASSFGVTFDQFEAAAALKGNDKDKNVSPDELAPFLRTKGLDGAYRVNGGIDQIEALVAHDIPVIVEQWLVKRGTGELVGHYRVVRGYDSDKQLFITNDAFNGPNFTIPYDQFDEWWRPFNRTYIPVFKLDQQQVVQDILGEDWDETTNWNNALTDNQAEVKSIGDGYAYFNLGSTNVALKNYPAAATAFDKSLAMSFPDHFLWYQFEPLEAYAQTGKYDRVLEMTQDLMSHAGEVEEARYYRAVVFAKQQKNDQAKSEVQKALDANSHFAPAIELQKDLLKL